MADEPVLLGLANGKRVMLWPGYRYVWRLAAKGYEPDEIGVVAGCGYGDHESGDS